MCMNPQFNELSARINSKKEHLIYKIEQLGINLELLGK